MSEWVGVTSVKVGETSITVVITCVDQETSFLFFCQSFHSQTQHHASNKTVREEIKDDDGTNRYWVCSIWYSNITSEPYFSCLSLASPPLANFIVWSLTRCMSCSSECLSHACFWLYYCANRELYPFLHCFPYRWFWTQTKKPKPGSRDAVMMATLLPPGGGGGLVRFSADFSLILSPYFIQLRFADELKHSCGNRSISCCRWLPWLLSEGIRLLLFNKTGTEGEWWLNRRRFSEINEEFLFVE